MFSIKDLSNFIPPEAHKPEAPKKKGFPEYPEGDLIARALRLAFVGGEWDATTRPDLAYFLPYPSDATVQCVTL
jgi:hypothetical protein